MIHSLTSFFTLVKIITHVTRSAEGTSSSWYITPLEFLPLHPRVLSQMPLSNQHNWLSSVMICAYTYELYRVYTYTYAYTCMYVHMTIFQQYSKYTRPGNSRVLII